jgi:hypothetical protein
MSITDELRHEVASYPFRDNRDFALFDAIADRIDEEHQKAIRELNNLVDACVLLPVDADGEIIHVGDMMERCEARGHVIALMLSEYPKKWGGGLHWSVQLEGEKAPTALDAFFHHYHKPTVEDLLFSYGQACICTSNEAETDAAKQTMLARLREDYAVKLRLADD